MTTFHWVILVVELLLSVMFWIAMVRILKRTGYSGWWSLLILVPIDNVIALWIFSKATWPALTPSGYTG
jgi:uncharacterized membrane protein YhaH (DUF805 family)